ncbi:MAG: hypothetical protein GXP16_01575 [Gammaproteobacteria bacterium]|nr:hypothetical protein [Gammaproteobacteria bacterium]
MASVVNKEAQVAQASTRLVRILQSIGAVVVTIVVLWFLFGIPAYLLFDTFFE